MSKPQNAIRKLLQAAENSKKLRDKLKSESQRLSNEQQAKKHSTTKA